MRSGASTPRRPGPARGEGAIVVRTPSRLSAAGARATSPTDGPGESPLNIGHRRCHHAWHTRAIGENLAGPTQATSVRIVDDGAGTDGGPTPTAGSLVGRLGRKTSQRDIVKLIPVAATIPTTAAASLCRAK